MERAFRYNVRLGSGSDSVDIPVSRRREQEVKQQWIQESSHRKKEPPAPPSVFYREERISHAREYTDPIAVKFVDVW
jgi:hypothetical protein